jgi:hypothetical protein
MVACNQRKKFWLTKAIKTEIQAMENAFAKPTIMELPME